MKQKLVASHDRSRGRFRALLQTVVKRRVVDSLRKIHPDPLDEAAIDAVKKWEYQPAVINGETTPMVTTMTVSFTLED